MAIILTKYSNKATTHIYACTHTHTHTHAHTCTHDYTIKVYLVWTKSCTYSDVRRLHHWYYTIQGSTVAGNIEKAFNLMSWWNLTKFKDHH